MDIRVDEKKQLGDLTDYFEELEQIRDELLKLSDASEDIKDTFYRLIDSEKRLKKEVDEEIKRGDKFEDRFNKVKNAYDELKLKYQELYRKHELLVDKAAMAKEDVYIDNFSMKRRERLTKRLYSQTVYGLISRRVSRDTRICSTNILE